MRRAGQTLRAAILSLTAGAFCAPASAELIGDAQRGATLFERQCKACHQIGEGAINRVGPQLNRIFGRRAGTAADFSYSKAMARMGADGLT